MSSKVSIILVWFSVIVLLVVGLVMVASTGVWVEPEDDQYGMLYKQMLFSGFGLIGALLLARMNYEFFRKYIWLIIGFACLLLVLCYVPGIGREINGERRWINLGIQFQPSECAKICTMMLLAHWYALHRDVASKFIGGFIKPGILFGIPLLLIFFEKDMGTASALGVAGLCVMFAAGANVWYLLGTIVVGFGGLYYMVQTNANRFRAMLGMQRGGIEGIGLGNSVEKHGTLPFAHTDFIFAPLGEEFGLIGTMTVLLCFSLFAFAGMSVAMQTNDRYGRLLAVGIVALVFCPAMLNIAVVTAALPNSGLPLPFISFGGTNLIFTLGAIGMLTSIQRHSYTPPPAYEFSRRDDRSVDLRL